MVTKSVLCGNCSRALVILVLIITIDSSYKAPFSNRVELTVLYKQLITHTHTHTLQTRNVFICCYRINKVYQKLSLPLSLTHTHNQHFILQTIYSHFHVIHIFFLTQKSFIIILQNYVTSHSASNFTNSCNVQHFFPQLIHYFSHCHSPSFLPPTFDQPPVLGFVQFTIVAMTPTKKKNQACIQTYNA